MYTEYLVLYLKKKILKLDIDNGKFGSFTSSEKFNSSTFERRKYICMNAIKYKLEICINL